MTRAEHRVALADDGDRLGDGGDLERELEILRHAEGQREAVLDFRREARQRCRYVIWAADAHALHEEAAITLRDGFVRAARRLVNGHDVDARDDGALGILDDACHRGGGDTLSGGWSRICSERQQRGDRAHEARPVRLIH